MLIAGAGLAGTLLARELVRGGCEVTLLEEGAGPATRASGNPAGIIKPIVTRTPTLPSELSFLAFEALHALLGELGASGRSVRGRLEGLLQLPKDEGEAKKLRDALELRAIPAELAHWLSADEATLRLGWGAPHGALWFPRGGWLEPRDLCVQALGDGVEQGRLTFRARHALALDLTNLRAESAGFDVIVFCLAENTRALPEFARIPTQVIRGQLSEIGLCEGIRFPEFPVAFKEYAIPLSPERLLLGATHDRGDEASEVRSGDHARLLVRIGDALSSYILKHAREKGARSMRAGLRFTASSHLPVVGQLPATSEAMGKSAYCLTALGSRGILFSPILARFLADLILERPSGFGEELAHALSPAGHFLD